MPRDTLKLTEKAWMKYGKKHKEDVLPQYKKRLGKLLQLCGTYPIGQGLPDWWGDIVKELREKGWRWESFAEFFEKTSVKEFRQGQFDAKRHKEYRQKLREEDQRKIISSPRIGKFLKEQFGVKHIFTIAFHDRGAKLLKKEVVITADPWDIVNMSTRGKSWTSCLNFIDNDCDVWTNLCDPGMVVALVRTQGDESAKNVDTRVILRYARTSFRKNRREPLMRGVIIDKFYGDAAYIPGVQKLVLKLCRKYGLCLFGYEDTKNKSLYVRGPWIKFPDDLPPPCYVNGADWIEAEKSKNSFHLGAEVRLIFAPKTKSAAA